MKKPLCTFPPPADDLSVISVEFTGAPVPPALADRPRVLREYKLITLAGEVLCRESRTPYESVTENLEAIRTAAARRWLRED